MNRNQLLTSQDIKEIEPEVHTGLLHILEYQGKLEEDLYQTFEVKYEVFGEHRVHELKVDKSFLTNDLGKRK